MKEIKVLDRSDKLYTLSDGSQQWQFPRITGVCGIMPKYGLVPAAAKLEREASDKWYSIEENHRLGKDRGPSAYKAAWKEARDIGGEMHDLIEKHLREGDQQGNATTKEAGVAYENWVPWWLQHMPEPKRIEEVVWSFDPIFKTAGTVDFFGTILYHHQRVKVILDWKSSKELYSEAFIQVSTYRKCMIEMGLCGEGVKAGVVRLNKTDEGDPWEMAILEPAECAEYEDMFPALREVWAFQDSDYQRTKQRKQRMRDAQAVTLKETK